MIKTNRNLLAFALLLILTGVGSGIYLVSVFGFILLIAAAVSSPRPRPYGGPVSSRQEPPRRVTPPVFKPVETPPVQVPTPTLAPRPAPAQTATFTPPLFPTNIFPTLSLPQSSPAIQKESKLEVQSSRDELLEFGALLVLLRLASG